MQEHKNNIFAERSGKLDGKGAPYCIVCKEQKPEPMINAGWPCKAGYCLSCLSSMSPDEVLEHTCKRDKDLTAGQGALILQDHKPTDEHGQIRLLL